MTVLPKDKLPDWIDFDLDIGDADPEWAIEFLNSGDEEGGLEDWFYSQSQVEGYPDYLYSGLKEGLRIGLQLIWNGVRVGREMEALESSNPLRQLLDECHAQGKLNLAGGDQ